MGRDRILVFNSKGGLFHSDTADGMNEFSVRRATISISRALRNG